MVGLRQKKFLSAKFYVSSSRKVHFLNEFKIFSGIFPITSRDGLIRAGWEVWKLGMKLVFLKLWSRMSEEVEFGEKQSWVSEFRFWNGREKRRKVNWEVWRKGFSDEKVKRKFSNTFLVWFGKNLLTVSKSEKFDNKNFFEALISENQETRAKWGDRVVCFD